MKSATKIEEAAAGRRVLEWDPRDPVSKQTVCDTGKSSFKRGHLQLLNSVIFRSCKSKSGLCAREAGDNECGIKVRHRKLT